MDLAGLLDDLQTLDELARDELDPARRQRLEALKDRIASRERGATVAEAARVLGLSQPTVRAWAEEGILPLVPESRPRRVELCGLADLKRALDLINTHRDDAGVLARVGQLLRDRALLDAAAPGLADYRAGRTVPLGDDLRAEIEHL